MGSPTPACRPKGLMTQAPKRTGRVCTCIHPAEIVHGKFHQHSCMTCGGDVLPTVVRPVVEPKHIAILREALDRINAKEKRRTI